MMCSLTARRAWSSNPYVCLIFEEGSRVFTYQHKVVMTYLPVRIGAHDILLEEGSHRMFA